MSQADFLGWIGPSQSAAPAVPNGMFYLDNNGVAQDQSASYSYSGGTGSGLLYVDGDLTLNGTFNYRGMIYVEGDLKINGSCWILGGLIVRGKSTLKANGNCTVLYSSDAIRQNISRYDTKFMRLSWREAR
jgi:hypothetical protein